MKEGKFKSILILAFWLLLWQIAAMAAGYQLDAAQFKEMVLDKEENGYELVREDIRAKKDLKFVVDSAVTEE